MGAPNFFRSSTLAGQWFLALLACFAATVSAFPATNYRQPLRKDLPEA
jgi:hypothetical protein